MQDSTLSLSPQWGECYFDHFESYLGAPVRQDVFELGANDVKIQVIEFDNVFGGCRAFCSFGLSRFATEIGQIAEVFMPIDDGWAFTPLILADVLFYMILHHIKIGWGRSISFADLHLDFVERFNKAAIYFAIPFGVPEGFEQVECGGKVGGVYLACYISEAEHQFRIKYGAEKFEELLAEQNVDVFQLKRISAI
jgi:hypothetical protein